MPGMATTYVVRYGGIGNAFDGERSRCGWYVLAGRFVLPSLFRRDSTISGPFESQELAASQLDELQEAAS